MLHHSRPDWADDVSEPDLSDPSALPAPVTRTNKDGTKTTISYRLDENNRRVKITRKTRTTIHRERVNPAIAERRSWAKFGMEKGKPKGPQPDTTSIAENMQFRPSVNWKAVQAEEAKSGANVTSEEKARKDALKDKKVKCRICSGEHFTARCPYKDTMAPVEEGGAAVDPLAEDEEKSAAGGLGAASGGYVPPHLRKGGAAGSGDRMGGKYERDDLATLRVTNVSTMSRVFEFKFRKQC
jgi:translation initiation factor 3 subunit G